MIRQIFALVLSLIGLQLIVQAPADALWQVVLGLAMGWAGAWIALCEVIDSIDRWRGE